MIYNIYRSEKTSENKRLDRVWCTLKSVENSSVMRYGTRIRHATYHAKWNTASELWKKKRENDWENGTPPLTYENFICLLSLIGRRSKDINIRNDSS